MTRSLYRSHWFEFLNAHLEDDSRGAAAALSELKKAARGVGVRRLSDFSRTAAHEGRKAEGVGNTARAARAYAAALELDDGNFSATLARIHFLLRQRSYGAALSAVPDAVRSLFATKESRLALLSAGAVWAASALLLTAVAFLVLLLVRHLPRILHDASERAARVGGRAVALPVVLALLLVPFAAGFGPFWVVLSWAAVLLTYTAGRERMAVVGVLILAGLVGPAVRLISREHLLEHSPLYVAAVDLEERREDGSAEDGLKQASTVFAEDADVWFLLGIYADRTGDTERAIACYDRAIVASPGDYRPFLNRGNVHFQDGEFAEAIRDYDAASKRAPRAPEVFYNLSIARGEAYDFDGQGVALAKAREISDRQVTIWSETPTVARVVSASYPLSRARRKVEQWNAQPKSRRLPGHTPPLPVPALLATPWTLVPWGALAIGLVLAVYRSQGSVAGECVRCGAISCPLCRRFNDPALYCAACARSFVRKEAVGIEAQVALAAEGRRNVARRDAACHVCSMLLPGSHKFFSDRPISAVVILLLFFFFASVAAVAERLFDARQLPPAGGTSVLVIAAAAAAFLIWSGGLLSSWRHSHGA